MGAVREIWGFGGDSRSVEMYHQRLPRVYGNVILQLLQDILNSQRQYCRGQQLQWSYGNNSSGERRPESHH